MITNALIYIIYGLLYVLTFPLRLLPDVSLPADATSAITSIGTYLANANNVIPLTTLASVLASVIAIELAIFTYKSIMWGIKRLPTQS